MKLKLFFAVIATAFALNVNAQSGFEYVQKGEFGVTLGAGHYFGDLNTKAGLNRPKPSFGIFYRSLEIILVQELQHAMHNWAIAIPTAKTLIKSSAT